MYSSYNKHFNSVSTVSDIFLTRANLRFSFVSALLRCSLHVCRLSKVSFSNSLSIHTLSNVFCKSIHIASVCLLP